MMMRWWALCATSATKDVKGPRTRVFSQVCINQSSILDFERDDS
jgi:hypothetical protein